MSDVPQVRVLFLHGLESAPSAKVGKIPDLKASFVDVCCPDLHTGRAQFNRKNSILRCLLRSAALRAAVASSALSLLGALAGRLPLGLAAAGVLAPFAFVLATYKTLLLPNAVEASVVASLAVARAALIAFKPDVVVGSSWGGALATLLLQRATQRLLGAAFRSTCVHAVRWVARCNSRCHHSAEALLCTEPKTPWCL